VLPTSSVLGVLHQAASAVADDCETNHWIPRLARRYSLNAAKHMPNSALFLDRDGVINVDRGYIHRFANASLFPEFSN
jgi:hypothetical protein